MSRTVRITALLTAGVAGMALAVIGLAPTASAAAAPADDHTTTGGFRPAPINWQPCSEEPTNPDLRCGTLQLPVDWAHPDGPAFGLAVAKLGATDPAQDEGPLVINPGGPGGSGVDFAIEAKSFFSPAILQHFDIIGFDPRGTNRSDPVQCSANLLAKQPNLVPASQADLTALEKYNAALGADCRANTGAIFDHVDTASVVKDIDAIRAALGDRQISYYGVSYGTLIGQEYAELFPDRVRALVIDSNMDHSIGTEPFLLTEAATDEDSFDQFVAWCDRDATCALHGKDVFGIWDQLMAKADAGTLTFPGSTEKISWWNLTQLAISALYGPDWSALGKEISSLYTGTPISGMPNPAGPRATGLAPDPLMVFCEDWSLPVSGYGQVSRYFAESKAVAPHLRVSTLGWGVSFSCLGSPTPVNDPQQRLHVHTDVPVLELNSVHDPATPYAWAVDDALQLGRHARFVTYLGWGHGAYPHTSCTRGVVDNYLLDITLPKTGTTCAAVPPPDQQNTVRLPAVGSPTGRPTFG